jgi:uncharacterized membrane protein
MRITSLPNGPGDPLLILEMRLAKGDITESEYRHLCGLIRG